MSDRHLDAPQPDLRIVPTESLRPHEEHDNQRAIPLAERLREETYMINPPIVAPHGDQFVILDGANRFHAFSHLGYPHILVQVVDYPGEQVLLDTWHHVVGSWGIEALLESCAELGIAQLVDANGSQPDALAHVILRDGRLQALIHAQASGRHSFAPVRAFVGLYQRSASLHRTAIHEAATLWSLYPDAIALVHFPSVTPETVLHAADSRDFLPPGISRHIVYGRAIRVNYPLDILRDSSVPLDTKNAQLQEWIRHKLANRAIRYYAESTFQFDE
ncbi:MAG: hypothetical protein IT320_05915 [Anaerolineae bacterium]|nr:hypothetical protein [Anaerolineae bacterium]